MPGTPGEAAVVGGWVFLGCRPRSMWGSFPEQDVGTSHPLTSYPQWLSGSRAGVPAEGCRGQPADPAHLPLSQHPH